MALVETSRLARAEAISNLADKQRTVLNAIRTLGIACNDDIAAFLSWPINCVCPRVKELREKGRIAFYHKSTGPHGRQVMYWQLAKFKETLF